MFHFKCFVFVSVLKCPKFNLLSFRDLSSVNLILFISIVVILVFYLLFIICFYFYLFLFLESKGPKLGQFQLSFFRPITRPNLGPPNRPKMGPKRTHFSRPSSGLPRVHGMRPWLFLFSPASRPTHLHELTYNVPNSRSQVEAAASLFIFLFMQDHIMQVGPSSIPAEATKLVGPAPCSQARCSSRPQAPQPAVSWPSQEHNQGMQQAPYVTVHTYQLAYMQAI